MEVEREMKIPKFRVGQVVAVFKSENPVPWYGRIEAQIADYEYDVLFPDEERLTYTEGELRQLTKREQGQT